MDGRNVAWASVFGATAVLFGAFGAHALKAAITPEALSQWHTAVEYQFYHALGLLLIGALPNVASQRQRRMVGTLFIIGVLLFSGSLYVLSTRELSSLTGAAAWLGPITPLGGLAFVSGWVMLLITALRRPVDR
ncbi:MAG: DUF423 domain-containing protein [Flavobacteriales bacterium]|nr:DUF423 domain-containing protein [Flavobacteriales bacterium]